MAKVKWRTIVTSAVKWLRAEAQPLSVLLLCMGMIAFGVLNRCQLNKQPQISQSAYTLSPSIYTFLNPPPTTSNSTAPCSGRYDSDEYKICKEQRDTEAAQQSAYWTKQSAVVGAFGLFFIIISLVISIQGLWFVKRTFEATLKAVEDGSKATNAALEANAIMRDEQRAWVVINVAPIPSLSYEAQSNTLMLSVRVNSENIGNSPAKDFAIVGKIKIIPKGQKIGLGSEDYKDLLREVAASVTRDSVARQMTETLFVGRPPELPQTRGVHAHLSDPDIVDESEMALVVCVAVSYKIPSGYGGAIWHGIITSADGKGMFANFVGEAKKAPVAVNVHTQPITYW
jgi:hypothetical protein